MMVVLWVVVVLVHFGWRWWFVSGGSVGWFEWLRGLLLLLF